MEQVHAEQELKASIAVLLPMIEGGAPGIERQEVREAVNDVRRGN